MKQHAPKGAEIENLSLEQVPYMHCLLHIARYHHERWGEGSGTRFDPACVEALLGRRDEVLGIMTRFADESSEAT